MRGSLTLSWGGSLLVLQCSFLVPLFEPSEILSSSCLAGGFDILLNLDLRSQNIWIWHIKGTYTVTCLSRKGLICNSSELTQQDGRGKTTANLVWQA